MLAGERVTRVLGVQDSVYTTRETPAVFAAAMTFNVLGQALARRTARNQRSRLTPPTPCAASPVGCSPPRARPVTFGKISDLLSRSHDRNNVGRWHAPRQQVLNDEAAQVTGRAGDRVEGTRHRATKVGEKRWA